MTETKIVSHIVSMEEVLDKDELIRVYSVDRAGAILREKIRFSDDKEDETTFEDRVMAFAERIEGYVKSSDKPGEEAKKETK